MCFDKVIVQGLVPGDVLDCFECGPAVEIHICQPCGQLLRGAPEITAGQEGHTGVFQQAPAHFSTGLDAAGRQFFLEGGKIREQVESSLRIADTGPSLIEPASDSISQGFQNPPGTYEVLFYLRALLKCLHGRILDRGAGRGERLRTDRRHGLEQPAQRLREHEHSQPPASGSAPLAEPAAEDGPFRIIGDDGLVLSVVMDLAIDLIREQHHAELVCHLGELLQAVLRYRGPCGIEGVVQDHEPVALRIQRASLFHFLRGQVPVVLELGRQKLDLPADNLGLGRIGNPAGRRDHQISEIDQLEHKHEFLGARADQDVVRVCIDAEVAAVVLGYLLSELPQPLHWEVVLLVGILPQRLNNTLRDREGRLSQAQLEDLFPLLSELV